MTDLYPLLVFVHVLGAVGIFASLGIESIALRRLQQEIAAGTARSWLGLIALAGRLGALSMLVTVVAGVALMLTGWRYQPWIAAAFAGILATAALGSASIRPLRKVRLMVAGQGGPELSVEVRGALSNRALAISVRLRIANAIGILALMAMKPGTAGSCAIVAAALAVGLASSLRPVPSLRPD